jgi:hypothetical protein
MSWPVGSPASGTWPHRRPPADIVPSDFCLQTRAVVANIFGELGGVVKNIIVYSRELKAQNLYPRRIISPPTPNKCCPGRMEVLGRPRLDEQSRRFSYKRCKVCGFALRHFLDPVGTILTPVAHDPKARKPLPGKDNRSIGSVPPPDRGLRLAPARKSVPARHVPRSAPARRSHSVEVVRKSAGRRRR